MTTAMVIDDLDDHGLQMMTGRTKNARIRSGSTPGPLRRQGRQQGDTGATAMAGTPPGTGGRPQGRPRDATAIKNHVTSHFTQDFKGNSDSMFLNARLHFCPSEEFQDGQKPHESFLFPI